MKGKEKRYEDTMGSRGEGRAKERENNFFFVLKIYEDQLGSKLEQQPFPGNGARKLVGYFKDCKMNLQAHGYYHSFHP